MPENPQNKATLVCVGDDGKLVFSAHGAQFVVEIDDALERAMLEAKQIKAEQVAFAQPSMAHSLPISQIQSLIRAGADPTKVAERYRLSDALVRRFSASVQTEKQYAIEQFLAIPAPKESRVHTIAELVERNLATAQIGMETVTWAATRRGLEPWRITAQFTSAGRRVHADWSWNMHNNAILSLNATAGRLMGERAERGAGHDTPDATNADILGNVKIPGDSVRSARIERAVSAWSRDATAQEPDSRVDPAARTPQAQGQGQRLKGFDGARQATREAMSAASPEAVTSHEAAMSRNTQEERADRKPSATITPISAIARRPFSRQPHDGRQTMNAPGSSSAPVQTPTSSTAETAAEQPVPERKSGAQNAQNGDAKGTKRKSGRSAVPSWDEILFGD